MKYDILGSPTRAGLVILANEATKNGWNLVGGIATGNPDYDPDGCVFFQAIVRYDQPEINMESKSRIQELVNAAGYDMSPIIVNRIELPTIPPAPDFITIGPK